MSKVFQGIVLVIVFLGFALLLFAFLNSLEINQPVTTKDVYQYIDHDAQIVCYILENGNGISCLPMSEVNLDE